MSSCCWPRFQTSSSCTTSSLDFRTSLPASPASVSGASSRTALESSVCSSTTFSSQLTSSSKAGCTLVSQLDATRQRSSDSCPCIDPFQMYSWAVAVWAHLLPPSGVMAALCQRCCSASTRDSTRQASHSALDAKQKESNQTSFCLSLSLSFSLFFWLLHDTRPVRSAYDGAVCLKTSCEQTATPRLGRYQLLLPCLHGLEP